MENNEPKDDIELPEDSGKDEGHSAGYYEARDKQEENELKDSEWESEEKNLEADHDHKELLALDAESNPDLQKIVRRKTIIGFSVLGTGFLAFILAFTWISSQPKDPGKDGALAPLRKVLGFNEKVNKIFFREVHLAPTYPKSVAEKKPKVNGDYGMDTSFRVADWQLYVVNIDKKDTLILDMDDIKKLPKTEICFNFKCIEGWSQVTHWGGVRFIDFVNYYKFATRSGKALEKNNLTDLANYAGFETPDAEYYVGLDIASALHPQTLLCYEMNGEPLPYEQGAPLRLIVPVKYGVKSLKRIGTIFFSDKRPHDYWFEQGYDYDAAL